ncbi:succinyl-diaminopimelate desuccinylase [Timonella sp. A28]|uniref:succinyl-diaminopimelate desuccinylase n=1 Tax=Timonella sp. A28 TaxID=3442640 RepID=UPI003EBF2095
MPNTDLEHTSRNNIIQLPVHDGPVTLTEALCNIESVSGNEQAIADAVEHVLRTTAHLDVTRIGNNIIARTHLARPRRVIIAGHLDTVPVADNLPVQRTTIDGTEVLWGRGTVDMKAGVAVQLALAVELTNPQQDITWCFYDNEEVDAHLNGLGVVARTAPELLHADFAILGEPSSAGIEGGCNGTMRAIITTHGTAAHSARAWMGDNAIHAAAPILSRLAAYIPETITVEGLDYREGMNAVAISGGIAGNVIPDLCEVTVNFRFAPSRNEQEAEQHIRELFTGFDVRIVDSAPGAKPGLDDPAAQEFAAQVLGLTGGKPGPKYGWTDVARFAQLGISAVNFGPGDAIYAHKDDEHCPIEHINVCYEALKSWLM